MYNDLPQTLLTSSSKIKILNFDKTKMVDFNYCERNSDSMLYWGAEMFLLKKFKDNNPNDEFIFIKHTRGSTSLHSHWKVNTGFHFVLAKQKLEKTLLVGKIPTSATHFMLWMQGESDASQANIGTSASIDYFKNQKDLFDFFIAKFPNIKIFAPKIKAMAHPNRLIINQAKEDIMNLYPNTVYTYSTDNYGVFPNDIVHYNINGIESLANDFYNKYF